MPAMGADDVQICVPEFCCICHCLAKTPTEFVEQHGVNLDAGGLSDCKGIGQNFGTGLMHELDQFPGMGTVLS